ncbi:MAG: DNA topoisomerase I [Candidatus Bathyarchaeia archaeon]|nr:DNA topoisomerase I [Candidatus Bathyarchaeota archaeon]
MDGVRLRQLIHSGVLVPEPYRPRGFHITVKGKPILLSPLQEEMAVAWVKKLGTDYAGDPVFVRNFFKDFRVALGLGDELKPEDVDFSEIVSYMEGERQAKDSMGREEKKRLSEERRALREANKARYGYAIVNGERIEIGNYAAEPSSIFMGRGRHPLRGRWKQGPTHRDIILNLSPDAPIPPGEWKEIVWDPDAMWIAKWRDKLTGKMKYIWLSDASPQRQLSDIEKFEKARQLHHTIEKVRTHILENLEASDVQRRKIATVCYLIDALKLRVGDEKDKDEADTVGATTLRPEHIHIKPGNVVTFRFLGKDYVPWRKEAELPDQVIRNLEEFMGAARSPIFKGVRSDNVSAFLGEAMPGLTAKVFRTYHATKVVEEHLYGARVDKGDPEYYKRYVAAMANLQAAITCNHKKKIPKRWRETLEKRMIRLKQLREKMGRSKKYREAYEKLKFRVKLMRAAKDYNLGTSLKSYIDPRVYYEWGRKIGYDWRLYYPRTLQVKFSWVERPIL